jgi:hypothetical protein
MAPVGHASGGADHNMGMDFRLAAAEGNVPRQREHFNLLAPRDFL